MVGHFFFFQIHRTEKKTFRTKFKCRSHFLLLAFYIKITRLPSLAYAIVEISRWHVQIICISRFYLKISTSYLEIKRFYRVILRTNRACPKSATVYVHWPWPSALFLSRCPSISRNNIIILSWKNTKKNLILLFYFLNILSPVNTHYYFFLIHAGYVALWLLCFQAVAGPKDLS